MLMDMTKGKEKGEATPLLVQTHYIIIMCPIKL